MIKCNSCHRLVYALLPLLFICHLCIAQFSCSTPCVSESECHISECDTSQGICVQYISDKPNCCSQSSDCYVLELCVYSSCNFKTNQCEFTQICEEESQNLSEKCLYDSQCTSENECVQGKCISGACEYQFNSELKQLGHCCRSSFDCPEKECSVRYCNVENFNCFYEDIKGCEISAEEQNSIEGQKVANDNSSRDEYYYDEYYYYSYTGDSTKGATIASIILAIIVAIFIAVFVVMIVHSTVVYVRNKNAEK